MTASSPTAPHPPTALVPEETRRYAPEPPPGTRLATWEEFESENIPPEAIEFVSITGIGNDPRKTMLPSMPNLRAVRTSSVGCDWLLDYLKPGTQLYNSGDIVADTTAETGTLGLLAALRSFPEHMEHARHGRWVEFKDQGYIQGVIGTTILVLGQGAIGQGIADRLEAFKARVIRFARTARTDSRGRQVLPLSDLAEWLPVADAVEIVLPLTSDTEHMVDAEFLGRMKPGAVLGNVGRGRIVDTQALLEAAQKGRVRAALDVVDPEPLPADHPLWAVPGVHITPHTGGSSAYIRETMRRSLAETAIAYLRGDDLGEPLRWGKPSAGCAE